MFDLFKGLLFGIAYVAPIGMQNLYVINTALEQPKRRAYLIAAVVIFFDISLSLACFFGVGKLLDTVPILKLLLWLIGGGFVAVLGVQLILAKETPVNTETSAEPAIFRYRKAIVAAFAIAWLNPQAILDGTLLLGAFRASLPGIHGDFFVGGVGLSSIIWFTGLTTIVLLLKSQLNAKVLTWINRVCGVVMLGYAAKLLGQFVGSVL